METWISAKIGNSSTINIVRYTDNKETSRPLLVGQGNISSMDIIQIFKSFFIKAKFFRLSHDVVTCDVDRDVSTAYC